jgi:hypothetical protein
LDTGVQGRWGLFWAHENRVGWAGVVRDGVGVVVAGWLGEREQEGNGQGVVEAGHNRVGE